MSEVQYCQKHLIWYSEYMGHTRGHTSASSQSVDKNEYSAIVLRKDRRGWTELLLSRGGQRNKQLELFVQFKVHIADCKRFCCYRDGYFYHMHDTTALWKGYTSRIQKTAALK